MTEILSFGSRIFQGICLVLMLSTLVESQTIAALNIQSTNTTAFGEKTLTNISQDGNDVVPKIVDIDNAQLFNSTSDKIPLIDEKFIEINEPNDGINLEGLNNHSNKEPTTPKSTKNTDDDDDKIVSLINDTVVNDKNPITQMNDVEITHERNSKLIENPTNLITDLLDQNKLKNLKYESESIAKTLIQDNNKTFNKYQPVYDIEKIVYIPTSEKDKSFGKKIIPQLHTESSTNNIKNINQEIQPKYDESTLENIISTDDKKLITITEPSSEQFKSIPLKRSEMNSPKINLLNTTKNKNDDINLKKILSLNTKQIIDDETTENPDEKFTVGNIYIIAINNDNSTLKINSVNSTDKNEPIINNNNTNIDLNIKTEAENSTRIFTDFASEQTTVMPVSTTTATAATTTTTTETPTTTTMRVPVSIDIIEESKMTTTIESVTTNEAVTTMESITTTESSSPSSSSISTSTSFIPSSNNELEITTIITESIETTTDPITSTLDTTSRGDFDTIEINTTEQLFDYEQTDIPSNENSTNSSTIFTTDSTTDSTTTTSSTTSSTTTVTQDTTTQIINDTDDNNGTIISTTIDVTTLLPDENITTTTTVTDNLEVKETITENEKGRAHFVTDDKNVHDNSDDNKTNNFDTKTLNTTISITPSNSSDTRINTTTPMYTETPKIPADNYPQNTQNIDEIVKIVVDSNWDQVCKNLAKLLAELLNTSINKTILPNQIIFKPNNCASNYQDSVVTLYVHVINKNGQFDRTLTEILPTLCLSNSMQTKLTIKSCDLIQNTDSGNAIAVAVVCCVAFICLVLLAGLLFIMRKRQARFNYGERCRPVSLDAYSLDSVSAYNSVRRKGAIRSSKRSYGNPTFEDSSVIPSHPLNFSVLSKFSTEINKIYEEYSNIPQVTAKIDELPQGADVKNRYANVIPLPETRVPLNKLNNDSSTEYINASYVRGPKNATKYYIACQAPMETTVNDFWRMIWEQQTKVIIMLTELVENDVEKCAEYIPPSEVTDCHRLFGDYQITLKKRETKEKYAISTLLIKNLENNTYREISHIWYLWPINGIQTDAVGMIAVLLEARALQRGGPGPIVVHCSPGTGRTGTLIALDLGIRQYEITRTVDVPRVVYTIRRDRAGAVQTKEQYALIYKALNLYATKLAGGGLEST
ncbi:probable serine/threonine-protein kinase nek3 isoform X2 [Aphidius gifuensis]|uniref:probable serine/threonine-protein kinase nek3 isoform X2 n=1 Tax=Aphidius gifuensis TaxID=684658 RepID=UPI001CDC91AB|nr:probable serine/threonine-protein kinase nek3 isoform X2 [Aphidius gifuensis]